MKDEIIKQGYSARSTLYVLIHHVFIIYLLEIVIIVTSAKVCAVSENWAIMMTQDYYCYHLISRITTGLLLHVGL